MTSTCNEHSSETKSLTVERSRIVKLFKAFIGKVYPLHSQAQNMLVAQTGHLIYLWFDLDILVERKPLTFEERHLVS